jgi:tripartite-type tricarboxylate transporter receptor subunit TctC
MLKRMSRVVLWAAVALAAPIAGAQSYPTKPVRIIVPFPAGGLLDGLARGLAQKMSESMGQPVLVEARPGANTMIGMDLVAKSAPDGYNLAFATDAGVSISPFLYSKMAYDPQKDLAAVSVVARTVECLLVPASLPVSNVSELVALAKAQPGKLNYGSFGAGSNAHLAAEGFKSLTGVDIVHVPFKGVAETVPALLANQIQVLFTSQGQSLPHIRAGKVKALAVMSKARQPTLPDVPTMVEQGHSEFDTSAWFGLMAPAGTPAPVIARLAAEVQKALAAADFRDKFVTGIGLVSIGSSPEQMTQMLVGDREKYARLVKAANVKLD